MRLPFLAIFALALGCSGWVEKDDRATFKIDRNQPFWLEFGRGSGWHGLDTIKLDQTGRVVLHRRKSENLVFEWEVATLQLSAEQVTGVLKAVESNGLMRLHRTYHENWADGTQWVLWIKQGDQEKSAYFNNSFPKEITSFAKDLDAILAKAGADKTTWQTVPLSESRQHERELWDSIKR